MYRSASDNFDEIRRWLNIIPVLDSHEHCTGFAPCTDPLDYILNNFYIGDFWSAGGEAVTGDADLGLFCPIPHDLPQKERYEQFQKFYLRSNKTAYARTMQHTLTQCWGVKDIGSYEGFLAFSEAFSTRNASVYDHVMDQMHIKAKIVDRLDLEEYLDGKQIASSCCHFALDITLYKLLQSWQQVLRLQRWLNRPIHSLDDYVDGLDSFFQRALEFGVVCLKDLSAYHRPLSYGNPSKKEAEAVFEMLHSNPDRVFTAGEIIPLDDWLFHYFLRKAQQYDLPVQMHTGHMSHIRNDVRKANAVLMIPILEQYPKVRFDLFHGNWPYMDEYLFVIKNYPNAYLDLCWAHEIDPVYCVELLKRAVMTIPHCKIFAFGGDTAVIEWVVGYLELAKDNVAIALAELVDCGWLSLAESKQLAADWFYNNINECFHLGYDPVVIDSERGD